MSAPAIKVMDDPVLARLIGNVEKAQAELHGYLSTGKAPPVATTLVDPNLVPLATLKALVPWSDDTLRRVVKARRLGRKIGSRWFADLPKFTTFIEKTRA